MARLSGATGVTSAELTIQGANLKTGLSTDYSLNDLVQAMILLEQNTDYIMRSVVYLTDKELEHRLKEISPVKTGLLKESWEVPKQYISQHKGKVWEVYCLNTATVRQQANRAYNMYEGSHRVENWRVGPHANKRYASFVFSEATPKTRRNLRKYNKTIQTVRQSIPEHFRTCLELMYGPKSKNARQFATKSRSSIMGTPQSLMMTNVLGINLY